MAPARRPDSREPDRPGWRFLSGLVLVAAALTADAWLPPVLGFVEVILGVCGLMQFGRGVRSIVLARRPGLAPATFDRAVRRVGLGFLAVLFAAGTIFMGWVQVESFDEGSTVPDTPWWAHAVLAVLTVLLAGMAGHAGREWRRAGPSGSAT